MLAVRGCRFPWGLVRLSIGVALFCSFSSFVVVSFTRRAARRLEGVSGCGGLFIVGEGPWVAFWCRGGDFAISAYDV